MITQTLPPAIKAHFPGLQFESNNPPQPVVTIHSKYPEIGDVTIFDDRGEATLVIGNITHSHFDPCDPDLSQDQIDQIVTESVIGFLNDLFNDRVLFWVSSDGQSGGWRWLDGEAEVSQLEKEFPEDGRFYLWSGPVKKHYCKNNCLHNVIKHHRYSICKMPGCGPV